MLVDCAEYKVEIMEIRFLESRILFSSQKSTIILS